MVSVGAGRLSRVSDSVFVLSVLPICFLLGGLCLWVVLILQVGSTEAGALYYERLLAERSFSQPADTRFPPAALAPRSETSSPPYAPTSPPGTEYSSSLSYGESSIATPTSYSASYMTSLASTVPSASSIITFPACASGVSCSVSATSSIYNGSSVSPTSSVNSSLTATGSVNSSLTATGSVNSSLTATGSVNSSATATGSTNMTMSVMVSTITVVSTSTMPGATVEITTTMDELITTTVLITPTSAQADNTAPPGFLPVDGAISRLSLRTAWLPCLLCMTSLLAVAVV